VKGPSSRVGDLEVIVVFGGQFLAYVWKPSACSVVLALIRARATDPGVAT